jgi:hypothetical protein
MALSAVTELPHQIATRALSGTARRWSPMRGLSVFDAKRLNRWRCLRLATSRQTQKQTPKQPKQLREADAR